MAPGLPAADSSPGLEHLRAGRIDDALAFFESRLAGNPGDAIALNMVGAILCMKEEPEPALAYFERALRHAPEFVAARKNLAIAEFELGRYESAEANLRELLAVPQARGQAQLFLGMIASESGQHEEAVQRLEEAGGLVSSQAAGLIALARSLQQLGRAEMAMDVLADLGARSDLTGSDLVDFAQVAASAGLVDEALGALERAGSLDPSAPGLGSRKVALLQGAGRDDEALALARGLAAGSPEPELLSRLAKLEENAGDLDAAVSALRKSIQVAPGREDGYIELSEFCVRYRNPELAIEILDLGLKRVPDSYRLLVQKGITLGQGQRYEPALQAFSAAIAVETDHAVALTALAVTLILSEQMPEALKTLEAGVARFPGDFYIHYIYGFALDRARADGGDEAAAALAARHLRRSIELNGEFASARYRLGKLLADLDSEGAIRNLEEAVRIDPSLVSAKYQLGQLYIDSGRLDEGTRLIQEVGESKQRQLEEEQMPQFRALKAPASR